MPWPKLPGAEKLVLLRPPNPYVPLMVHARTPAYFHLVNMASAPPLCQSTGSLRYYNGGMGGGRQGMGGPSPLETQSTEDEMLVENEA